MLCVREVTLIEVLNKAMSWGRGWEGEVVGPSSKIQTKLKKCERRRKYKISILMPKMKFKEMYSFILNTVCADKLITYC